MRNKTASKCASGARFVLLAALIFLFFTEPTASADGIKRGLSVCAGTLIPSLFPFMVISELLVRSGVGEHAARVFGKPMSKLFGVSGAGAAAVILGILCGFPVGAKTASALRKAGELEKDEAARLMTFCNYPSAPFLIFAVGRGLFGSKRTGLLIWLSVLASGLICGIAGRVFCKKSNCEVAQSNHAQPEPITVIFTEAVTGAASSLIAVCSCVCFFTAAVSCLSALITGGGTLPRALLFSFFELTSGAASCAAVENRFVGAVLCSAAAAWSGLSVFFQISSLARGIPMKPFLISKLFTVPLSSLITALVLRLFPDILISSTPAEDAFHSVHLYPDVFISLVNIIFIVSVLFYLTKLLDRCARI
ncbi:MAG: nucleoside recognition domain-containing protein [Eubacteriales bacterium]